MFDSGSNGVLSDIKRKRVQSLSIEELKVLRAYRKAKSLRSADLVVTIKSGKVKRVSTRKKSTFFLEKKSGTVKFVGADKAVNS